MNDACILPSEAAFKVVTAAKRQYSPLSSLNALVAKKLGLSTGSLPLKRSDYAG
jgi:hypothetical protein